MLKDHSEMEIILRKRPLKNKVRLFNFCNSSQTSGVIIKLLQRVHKLLKRVYKKLLFILNLFFSVHTKSWINGDKKQYFFHKIPKKTSSNNSQNIFVLIQNRHFSYFGSCTKMGKYFLFQKNSIVSIIKNSTIVE